MRKRSFAILICLLSCLLLQAQRYTDSLDRGLVAVKTSGGVFVSWHIFGEEYYDTRYNLYRDGVRVNGAPMTLSNFTDKSGTSASVYTVAAVVCGEEQAPCAPVRVWSDAYLSIPVQPLLSRDGQDVTSLYSLNDVSMADVNGDGRVELIVKRPCSTAADLSNKTAFHVLDCYTLDGERLWWIDLGPNMLSGADEQWDCVGYDWDQDGKAEIILRGQDNMILHHPDGTTTEVGSMTVDTRWDGIEYTSSGTEYLFYLEGATARPYTQMAYPLPRGKDSDWGEGIVGHRSTKHFFGAPCLDGRHASLFLARGIYTKEHMKAFDIDPASHQLSLRWEWKSDGLSSTWYGQGYHNYGIADVDLDGRDEIVYGSMVIDDNGKGLSTTGLGHGDAQHCGDLDPYRPGLEIFCCNESSPAMNYRNATTSKLYFRAVTSSDDGRALCANFTNDYPGSVGRSVSTGMVSCTADKIITELGGDAFLPWGDLNWRIWWDGDLCDEYLESPGTEGYGVVYKPGTGNRLLSATGTKMNNWTKNNPAAVGDILGDWREEVVLRSDDNRYLRVYTTTERTSYPISTLWHDHQYRNAMVWQCLGYNQPPHASFFLGELEGITKEPPPLTLTGRTEILPDQTIGKELDGQHVLLCETDNMTATLAPGARPRILTDNAPSWTEGTNDNNDIRTQYYAHRLRGALSGDTRLVKQGEGELMLESFADDYCGQVDLWAGSLSFEQGTGTMSKGTVWMNRFTTFCSELQSKANFTLEYGATLRPHNELIDCVCPGQFTADTLSLHIGAKICFHLIAYDGESPECDHVGVHRLELQTTQWKYGPEYQAPVFEFVCAGDVPTGRFPILDADAVEGDLSAIVLRGLEGRKAYLEQEGTTVYLVIEGVRDASSVVWTGAQDGEWNFAGTRNFRSARDGSEDLFVGGDKVLFNDSASTFKVTLQGDLPCDTVVVDNTTTYTFTGTGALTGTTTLVKRGTGTLVLETDNTYTGGNRIEGGTVRISSLANSTLAKGNLGAMTTAPARFVLSGGGTLQTMAAVTCSSPITLEGEGGILSNSADFTMEKAFTGTLLTKKGSGHLKLLAANPSLNRLTVASGTVTASQANPAKAVEMQGGTLVLSEGSSVPVHVPEGRTATLQCQADRGTYANRLTGAGTLTVSYPLVKGSGWYATRAQFNGDWSAFEGTVVVSGVSADGRFCLNNTYGLPRGTLSIPAGYEVQNSGKTWRIGALTGSGVLGGGCTFSNNTTAGTNTWQVGTLDTDCEFGGRITGGATKFEKVGTGTLTLTGQGSDHTGTNTVTGGTLCLNNNKATQPMLGTGTLTLKSGTALTGTGRLANTVSVMSGALLRPGVKETSVSGTLDFGQRNVTVAAGATVRFCLSSATLYTKLTGISTFKMSGDLVIDVREGASGFKAGKEFVLWTATTSAVSWSSLTLSAQPGEGLWWDIADLATHGILRITDDPALGVGAVNLTPELLATEWYDLQGRCIPASPSGICIRRDTYADGTVTVTRVMQTN